jgi:hypothetical protein
MNELNDGGLPEPCDSYGLEGLLALLEPPKALSETKKGNQWAPEKSVTPLCYPPFPGTAGRKRGLRAAIFACGAFLRRTHVFYKKG